MFENLLKFFKKLKKSEEKTEKVCSKDQAKERLHLVLMQDRANVSADFLEMMKQEIIEVIKKYIEVDEKEIDVRLTNEIKEDGTTGAPSLYANIPIVNIRNDMQKDSDEKNTEKKEEKLLKTKVEDKLQEEKPKEELPSEKKAEDEIKQTENDNKEEKSSEEIDSNTKEEIIENAEDISE